LHGDCIPETALFFILTLPTCSYPYLAHTPNKQHYTWAANLFPQTMARLCGKVIQIPQQMALNLETKYPSTLANSTLIILFSEMLKFSKIISYQIKKYFEGK
jgi:hypothetical protein